MIEAPSTSGAALNWTRAASARHGVANHRSGSQYRPTAISRRPETRTPLHGLVRLPPDTTPSSGTGRIPAR